MKLLTAAFILLLFATNASALGLKVGDKAPNINLTDVENNNFSLSKAIQAGPIVLVFYRGGWCPYCNLQLRSLQSKVVAKLKPYAAQMVAISVDAPDKALATQKKQSLGMTVLSDPKAEVVKSYNVVNQLKKDLVKKYKESYSIDIEGASGEKHHIIAVPAVFIVDSAQKITFAYADEDYKVRAQESDILSALEKMKKKK